MLQLSLYLGLPLLALSLLIALFAIRKRATWWPWMLTGAASGGAISAVLLVVLILRQKSSTAAIGILFVPMLAAAAALASGVGGLCLYKVWHWRESWRGGLWARLSWLLAAGLVVLSVFHAVRLAVRIHEFDLARDESTDPRRIEDIYRGAFGRRDYFVLSAVARNPRTPPALLLALAQADDAGLHAKRHALIDAYDRDQLAVVRHLLRNPSLPGEAIPVLARSTDAYVVGDVAAHRQTPEPILRELFARSGSYLVHWGLSDNPSTPPDILEQLALSTAEADPGSLGTQRPTRQNLAGNGSTPANVLATLAKDRDGIVRRSVARNPETPPEVMAQLAHDPEEEVRFYLAINTRLAPAVSEELKQDPSERVRKYAAEPRQDPRLPPATAGDIRDEGGCLGPTRQVQVSFAPFRIPQGRRLEMIVANNSPGSIRGISIGSVFHREMQSNPDNVPLSIESPPGWKGQAIHFEEDAYMQILWESAGPASYLQPGRILQKFAVDLPPPRSSGLVLYGPDGRPGTPLDFADAPFNTWFADGSCRWGRTRPASSRPDALP